MCFFANFTLSAAFLTARGVQGLLNSQIHRFTDSQIDKEHLAWAVGIPVSLRSGSRLTTTIVATMNGIIFFSFLYLFSFLHCLLFSTSAILGPWPPFWIFEVLIEGMIESKNWFSQSWSEGLITSDPVRNFGLSGWWGVAGSSALQAVSECPRRH